MQLGHQKKHTAFEEVRRQLLPAAERDAEFREYLGRLTHSRLQILGVVEIAGPLLVLFSRLAVDKASMDAGRFLQVAAMALVGVVTLLVADGGWSRRHARMLAVISAFAAPAMLVWAGLWKPTESLGGDDYLLIAIMLVIVTVAATVPLLPWHALALGLGIEGMYILSCHVAARWELPASPLHSEAHYIFLLMLALLATGIAAANYSHYEDEYHATQSAVQAAEALTGAQLRAQLAENAISVGKMAAALSHEINSPLGTLRSSIETLMAVTDRQVHSPSDEQPRLEETRAQLRGVIEESAARIDEVTKRLRRFVNLDEADMKAADLNELLADVTLLHEQRLQKAGVRLNFDLEKSLPLMICRPQLLSAVFSTLLSNAIDAVNGDGRIAIETRGRGSEVEVTVRDNGRGMPPEEVETIFDPTFRVNGSRVASANWSLFNSRQIVYEHGGEIRIETTPGQGTAVHVTLPLAAGM